MRRRNVVTAMMVASMFALGTLRPAMGGTREEEAEKAARSWLALVDQAKYAESWDEAAPSFKKAISQDQWRAMVVPVREPLGKVLSRTLKSSNYMESIPGAPSGRYVVIQFTTEFANKKGAVETVTPMADPDGAWRVSGYYIK
jgi:Protein of unknown function (DUF4019)